jgi:CheY-like chemotaxis protein
VVRRRSHPADLTDLHILVVEDNELNLEIAVFSLEAAGLNVSTAINGLEAVQLFEKSKPYEYDIILMDIMMPVMNGLDAAKAIRGLSRPDATTVPIIALSANAFAEDIVRSSEAGMDAHITKPIDENKLKECMLRLLASR